MSNRPVGGLPPRKAPSADLSRMMAKNRQPAEQPTTDDPAPVGPPPATEPPRPAAAPVTAAAPEGDAPKSQNTVYLTTALRNRARTAFRATAFLEGETTWSDVLETAVLREVERREELHNGGKEYPPDTGNLPRGRRPR